MVASLIFNPKEEMAKHLECLRGYAERVFVNGETLSPDEEEDRAFRMREFVTTGVSFRSSTQSLSQVYRCEAQLGRVMFAAVPVAAIIA